MIYGTIGYVAVVGDISVCLAGFSRPLAVPARDIDWYSREKRKKGPVCGEPFLSNYGGTRSQKKFFNYLIRHAFIYM